MRTNRLHAALDWLREVPVADVLERRHAPVLQLLMLFIVFSLPANWCYHLLLVRAPTRRDVTLDVAVDVLVWGMAWLSLALIRRGRLRTAIALFVGAMLTALTVMYLSIGLTRQLLDQTYPVLTIVLGGLVLGRRALWLIYALLMAMFCAGGVVDVMDLGQRAYPRPWLGAANLPSLALSYFVITLVLDRCVAAMRNSLDEAHRMSGALAAANASLREEMGARERAREKLIHAQKMETVGRLASGVAHDFNNVLAVIAGYVERSQTSGDAGQLRQAIHGVSTATRRGMAVSRKLLSFSRQDSSRPEVFDIAEAVSEVEPMLRQLFSTGVSLQLEIAAETTSIRMDRGQFELILLNIAANARDAMEGSGHFQVTVGPCASATSGAHGVALSLGDDGCGMSEAVRARVFEPFFTTKSAEIGTGLGLAVVRDVIHACGGEIAVESSVGQGTTFRLWFPRAAEQCRAEPGRQAVRVLLVEDDDELRELLLAALDDAGCVALGAGSASDAGRLLAEAGDSLEVVVTDCRMPGGDGSGQLRWLDTAVLPVVLISASGEAEARRLRGNGLDVEYLPKPFPPTLLVERVRAIARRYDQRNIT
ncbi:ATP-binding protein [Rhodanobacter umsongensis]|uniref:histidine kinase n=1 Tax=Rhodanobacter umsongensis TaxID=633153 RepID=A0ABW0JJF1_9GAMM